MCHVFSLCLFCCFSRGPPPALPYIFKFGPQGSLYLCGPADKRLQRPTSFEGPGLCIMERVDHAMPMPMLRQESVPTQMPFGKFRQ